ncbi:peptide-N4-(N-acetyl-beta- glucosaminyl)asparagine amidase, partial [Cladochytrium tenue]
MEDELLRVASDVVRYSRALQAVYRRRLLGRKGFVESLTKKLTEELSETLSDGLSPTARKELEERDAAEELERRSPPVSEGGLVGWRSGGEEWRTARQESRGVQLKKTNLLFDLAGSEMSLVGSAVSNFRDSRRTILLTENRTDQVGAAWTPARLPVDRSFVADFVFLIDRKGADGLAFVVQGAPAGAAAVGKGGGSLGYAGLPRSLAVEFDTYQGRDTSCDPSDNHVAVMSRGAAPNSPHHLFALACCARAPPLHGRPLAARVVYHAAQSSLTVWLAEAAGDAANDPLKDEDYACLLDAEGVDLAEVVQAPDAFLGFTAATGGISQAHSILFFTVHLAADVAIAGLIVKKGRDVGVNKDLLGGVRHNSSSEGALHRTQISPATRSMLNLYTDHTFLLPANFSWTARRWLKTDKLGAIEVSVATRIEWRAYLDGARATLARFISNDGATLKNGSDYEDFDGSGSDEDASDDGIVTDA